jgi:hypothetical protein
MARKLVLGTCHICGTYTKLSFEHVPPHSAFNDRPAIIKQGIELVNANLDNLQGKISQRGVGSYTLCESCNSDTGAWYGTAFAEWAHQGMTILAHTQGQPSLYYTFHIFPLRGIKQIICMFFSANGAQFRLAHQHLVRFVLNRGHSGLHPHIQIFAYFNIGPPGRYTGMASAANINTGTKRVLSEIVFPPIGYVMAFDSEPPDNRLVDISFFAKYHYTDWKHISLRLPALSVYTYFPGDYQNREQVLREVEANR